MAKKWFIPKVISQLKTWLNTYKTKIGTLGASVGLTVSEIAAQQADCDAMIADINAADMPSRRSRQQLPNKT